MDEASMIELASSCAEEPSDSSALRISQISDMYRYDAKDLYPPDRPWVLRNLTTKEYVRAEAIAISPEYIHGPEISYMGFGEVVLPRISWSAEADPEARHPANLRQGVWAGHRFEIITLDRHQQCLRYESRWKDISTEVAAELARTREAQFGKDWRDTVVKRAKSDVSNVQNRKYVFAHYRSLYDVEDGINL